MRSLVLAVMLSWSALLPAADLSQPHILVATGVTLGKVFPEHGPSQKIAHPVYLGGPIEAQAIFALVQRPDSPGGNSLEVLPGLYAAFEAPVVDRIIESEADHARFVANWFVLEDDLRGEPAADPPSPRKRCRSRCSSSCRARWTTTCCRRFGRNSPPSTSPGG